MVMQQVDKLSTFSSRIKF